MSAAEGPPAVNGDRDSADIIAILEDTDLSNTIRNIRTARKVPPENPARALRLLDLIGTYRPVEGLIDDAARFSGRRDGDRDATHILGVAALHRSVAETAGILLAKWPSDLAKDVARTFARQRPTLDVPSLIRYLKNLSEPSQAGEKTGATDDEKDHAKEIIDTVLSEFAWGDVKANVGGRPTRDISLVHVRLTAERCDKEAYDLLSKVFKVGRPSRFTYDLARDLLHDTPRTDVVGEWARSAVERGVTRHDALNVMQGLIHHCGSKDSWQARQMTHKIGTQWTADWMASLCIKLEGCTDPVEEGLVHDCADKAAAIRRQAASRAELDFVTALIKAWWGHEKLSGSWEILLDEAVSRPVPRPSPLPVPEVIQLAEWVAEGNVPEAANMIRVRVHLAGCDGTDVAELVGAIQPKAYRRREALQMARRMAAAAKARTVRPEAVAAYIRSLRQADGRQAADDARDALTPGTGGDPFVVPRVAVALAERQAPRKGSDADMLLSRYLTNHAALAPADVVAVFEHLDQAQGMTEEYLADLVRRTLVRWPPVPRNEANEAFRKAGMDRRADQISRR